SGIHNLAVPAATEFSNNFYIRSVFSLPPRREAKNAPRYMTLPTTRRLSYFTYALHFASALTKNDPFALTKNDRHREHDLARANDCIGLCQHHPRRRRAQ